MDRRLLTIIFVLVIFGLVVLSSAGIVEGQKKFGSPYYYLNHQFLFGILPGLVLMFLLANIDYRFWKKMALPILMFSLVLMILVFLPSWGHGLKGATRWLSIKGLSFQPSELLKISLVIYLAAWFGSRNEKIKSRVYGVAPFFILLGFICLLLALQPDIGTLMVVAMMALGLYFMAGANLKTFGGIILIILIGLAVLVAVEPYRFNRIKAFLNPSVDTGGISYQINQSLISIGSGGLFGVGYGHSTQKFGFLPEVVGDSIFAVIAEELGYVGSVATIGLFVILSLTLINVAKNAPDKFGTLLVMGVNVWIMVQAFVNIAAISGLAPLTGIPLPFISYGGTAIIALLSSLGIVLNVTRRI